MADRIDRERQKYADYDDLKSKAERLAELEDAQKSEQEKLAERMETEVQARTAAEQRAAALETSLMRHKVAAAKGLTPAQAERLRGSTEEEIAVDADELLAAFAPPEPDRPAARTPVERLRPGAVPPDEASAVDMSAWMRQKPPTTN